MITQITGQNIKGLTFAQDIGPLTLIVGPNGAGKSARSQAIILALLGYIPGSGKKNDDILDTFGDKKEMSVGVMIDDILFQRKYSRVGDSVSQNYGVAGKKRTREQFAQAMGEAGNPKAIDINVFMDLSDQKKIDFIMDLYPPETDISQIVADIEATKTKINNLTAKAKSTEDAAARLATARAARQSPAGTLADVQAQIRETEEKLAQIRQDLKDAEIQEAQVKAAAEAKEKADAAIEEAKKAAELEGRKKLLQEQAAQLLAAEEKQAAVSEEKCLTDDVKKQEVSPPGNVFEMATSMSSYGEPSTVINGPIRTIGQDAGPFPGETKADETGIDVTVNLNLWKGSAVEASIKSVLAALNGAGCTACAARLVCIREMRKYHGKEAA